MTTSMSANSTSSTSSANNTSSTRDMNSTNDMNSTSGENSTMSTSITELSTADASFDNQTVQVVGEAVGDTLKVEGASGYRWITLAESDAESGGATNASISVYMTEQQASLIDTFGAYGSEGTILQVSGTYHLACTEHFGESDLHAETVTVAQAGSTTEEAIVIENFIPGVVLIVLGFVLMALYYFLRERRR